VKAGFRQILRIIATQIVKYRKYFLCFVLKSTSK
jgi:hypothetical protein